MQIDERTVADVTVLAVSGEITLNSGGGLALKQKVATLMEQGKRQLVLELGGVTYVDSAGLGQLVQVQLTTAGQGGTLKLANTGPRLRQLLAVAKLSSLFDAHDTEASAQLRASGPASSLRLLAGVAHPGGDAVDRHHQRALRRGDRRARWRTRRSSSTCTQVDRIDVGIADVDRAAQHRVRLEQLARGR